MNIPLIRYLVLSDIHLGHYKNRTIDIVEHLDKYFIENNKLFSGLNAIFVAGDIYERLLSSASDDYILTTQWFIRLIVYAAKHNIILRVLEGTKSHDSNQAKVIDVIISELNISINFKYVDTLSIENITSLGLNVLYVPDEWNHKASDTFIEIKQRLKEHNLSKVDIVIMHGQFHYQLPMIELESSHDEKSFLDITNYFISVGHIHTHTIFERILAQGSFDRLAHNEEEAKGAMVITLRENGNHEHNFIVNKHATSFTTIEIIDHDINNVIKFLNKRLSTFRDLSHIRFSMDKNNPIRKNIKEIRDTYKHLYFTIKDRDKKIKEELHEKLLTDNTIESFTITQNNIRTLLTHEFKKHELTSNELNIIFEELDSVV